MHKSLLTTVCLSLLFCFTACATHTPQKAPKQIVQKKNFAAKKAPAALARQSFKTRTEAEIASIVGNVNEPSSQPWLNYIFDVQVSSGGRALEQFNGLHSNPENTLGSAHSLRRPGSIGTHDEVHSTQVSTELWHDISMDKARAYIAIDSNLKNTGEKVLPPDTASGSLRANLYCEEWAQARASTSDAKLKKAFKKNWQKQRTVKVTAPMKPYPVGAYWVIPVEVTLPKSDFNSNCL